MYLKQKNAKFYSLGSLLPLPSCSAFWEVRAGEGKKVAKSQDCVCIPYISHPLVPARRNPPFSKQVRSPGQFSFLGSQKLTVRIRVLLNYSRINNNHASGNCWPFAISSFFSNTVLRITFISLSKNSNGGTKGLSNSPSVTEYEAKKRAS